MRLHDVIQAARLWKQGMDTQQIASALRVRESEVYNVLELIKSQAKQLGEI